MKASFTQVLAGSTILAGAIAAAVAAPQHATNNPLRVSMYAAGDGAVEVIVTNTSRKAVRVPSWELPGADNMAKLFNVSLDGEKVAYEGALAKRGLPGPSDFVVLPPGRSYRSVVNLGADYDLSKRGQYNVTLVSPLQHASMSDGRMLKNAHGLPMLLRSVPTNVWSEGAVRKSGGSNKGKPCNPNKQDCGGGGGGSSDVTFVGCSATQITDATAAVAQARSYSENAKGYLNTGTSGPRYTTWFGSYTSQRYGTAQQHFVAIDSAIDQNNGQVTINCGCNQNYYAYVYPTRPYEIFVCRAFWSAPTAGTDSKGGTLIHEMSHFNVVAGTDDVVYGQTGAKNLAISDPAGALNNADSHEYFAENKPSQN